VSKSQPVTSNTTTSNSIPDWLSSLSQSAGTEASNLPQYTPYTGAGVAGLNSTETQGINLAGTSAGQGQGITSSAVGGANNAINYSAPTVSTGDLNTMTNGLLDPYTKSVIDAANNQIQYNTNQAMSSTDTALAGENAFGGSRQAVADADVQNQGAMTKASTDSGLLSQGYQTALSTALSALQGNQNASVQGAAINLGGTNALSNIGSTVSAENAQDISNLLQAGELGQNTTTGQNMFNYQNYLTNYGMTDQQAQQFASILGALPYSSTGTSDTTGTVYTNGLLGALGAGLGVAGLKTSNGGTIGGNALSSLGTSLGSLGSLLL
jgi:hypothetical protein